MRAENRGSTKDENKRGAKEEATRMGWSLGERIRSARLRLSMTQEELAGKHFTKGFISLLELDKAKPSLESLSIIAAKLNKPLTYFLEDLTDTCREIDLRIQLGHTHLYIEEFDKAAAEFRAALEMSERLDDERRKAESLQGLGVAAFKSGGLEEAVSYLREAVHIYEKLGLRFSQCVAWYQLGASYQSQGMVTKAIESYLESLKLSNSEEVKLPFKLKLLANLAHAYRNIGVLDEAEKLYEEALALGSELQDFCSVGKSFMGLGLLYRERGEVDQALHYTSRAMQLFEMFENLRLLADVHNNLGVMLADGGQWDAAYHHYCRSLHLRDVTNDRHKSAYTLTEIARYYHAKGELNGAWETCEKALALLRESDHEDQVEIARIQVIKGLIEKDRGNATNAFKLLQDSAEVFRARGARRELAEVCTQLGLLFMERGETAKSNELLVESLNLFTEKPLPTQSR